MVESGAYSFDQTADSWPASGGTLIAWGDRIVGGAHQAGMGRSREQICLERAGEFKVVPLSVHKTRFCSQSKEAPR